MTLRSRCRADGRWPTRHRPCGPDPVDGAASCTDNLLQSPAPAAAPAPPRRRPPALTKRGCAVRSCPTSAWRKSMAYTDLGTTCRRGAGNITRQPAAGHRPRPFHDRTAEHASAGKETRKLNVALSPTKPPSVQLADGQLRRRKPARRRTGRRGAVSSDGPAARTSGPPSTVPAADRLAAIITGMARACTSGRGVEAQRPTRDL
jgi:hypothetical protein